MCVIVLHQGDVRKVKSCAYEWVGYQEGPLVRSDAIEQYLQLPHLLVGWGCRVTGSRHGGANDATRCAVDLHNRVNAEEWDG